MKKLYFTLLILLLCLASCGESTTEKTVFYDNGTYQVMEYNRDGFQVKTTFYAADGTVDYTESRYYHASGTLALIERYYDGVLSLRYEYDENGNKIRWDTYHENGVASTSYIYVDGVKRTRVNYNKVGKEILREEYNEKRQLEVAVYCYADGIIRFHGEFEYNAEGQVIGERYYKGDGTLSYATKIEYDDKGERAKETYFNPDGTVEKVINYEVRKEDAVREMLKEAYLNLYIRPNRADATADEVYIRKYLGEYHGVYALMIAPFDALFSTDMPTETIDGVTFYYSSGQKISVYDGVGFYSLREAFGRGLLSHEDLVAIEERHGGMSINEQVKELVAKTTVRETYYKAVVQPQFEGATIDEISICKYYGEFGNVYVAMVTTPYFDYTEALWNEKIDGIVIHYTDGNRALAFYDGAVYTLTEAFKRGLLTHDDLQAIADIQNQ